MRRLALAIALLIPCVASAQNPVFQSLTTSGPAVIGGTLGVTGAAMFSGTYPAISAPSGISTGNVTVTNPIGLVLSAASNNQILTSAGQNLAFGSVQYGTTFAVNQLMAGTGQAANYIYVAGSGVGQNVAKISSQGTDPHTDLRIDCAGLGPPICTIRHIISTTGADTFDLTAGATNVSNGITITSQATGIAPVISAMGSDTNIGITLSPKGTGIVGATSALSAPALLAAGSANQVTIVGASAGNAPAIYAQGSDTNINLYIQPQGTGNVLFQQSGGQTTFAIAPVSGGNSAITVFPGITASQMPQLYSGDNNIMLGGAPGGGAIITSATTGFPAMPFTAGAPTGTPANSANAAAFEINSSSKTLNIYIPGGGWYHAALTAGAG